jgi:7-carboxy-7-deazaguanine synthase
MTSRTSYPIMEQFYTIQGEGVFAGFAAWFIRLAGCDVGCVWCDVKDSWDASQYPEIEVSSLVADAAASGAKIAVITGGEPAMYDLTTLTQALKAQGLRVHIETSAAHPLRGHFDWVTLSPKKFKFPLDGELIKANELKVIVYNKSDLQWAQTFENRVGINTKLLLQPEWDKREAMLPLVIDFVKNNPHWQISLQTHKYIGVP